MSVRHLFVDFNAYFASVEQQERPELRGRPVAVVPVLTDRTCCIAASYEARPFGIRTGTNVGEARRMCPGLRVVEARPDVYVRYHHRIIEAVDSVLPVDAVCSIDEMSCRLGEGQREPDRALKLGSTVKSVLRERIGQFVKCSVGLAPNRFLAKVIGESRKPDGLTLLRPEDLPERMFSIPLGDLTGIGPRMLERLERAGITTVEELYGLDEWSLQRIWGSVVGRRWWYVLRGHDLGTPASRRKSLGHSHVLPPEFRTAEGSRSVLLRLIHKAAARLRREGLWAGRMEVLVSFVGTSRWGVRGRLRPCRDTSTFVQFLADRWDGFPKHGTPLKVAVTFTDLTPNESTSRSLFAEDDRRERVSAVMDSINARFGVDCLHLAAMHAARGTAPARIAFDYVPDVEAEGPGGGP